MSAAEMINCEVCGGRLIRDEIALNKKLNGPETEEFLCLECMAEEFGVTVQDLEDKIEYFKESGCTLFED
jgi:hypothetical protein